VSYSYNRRVRTAAKLDVHDKWSDIVRKHEAAEQQEFQHLLHELVNYFKSNGFDLDVSKSYIGKEWHGSDGWRRSGQLTITEREENNVKSKTPEQVKVWVEEATGLYGYPKKISEKPSRSGPHPGEPVGTWVVDIGEY
jgi:hypothetical protein